MLESGRQWTKKHMTVRSAPDVTLAIQTLRNTVLVATFVGTLSFTVASTTLAYSATTDSTPARLRALLQASLLTGSFLNFALVIRCSAHAGYLIGSITDSPQSAVEEGVATSQTDRSVLGGPQQEIVTLLGMQAIHFSLGFRFMYCSIPFAFAIGGAEVLIAATCVVLAFLYYIDNALFLWGLWWDKSNSPLRLA